MTAVLVAARTDLAEYFKTILGPTAVVVQYHHPIKAMDNLAELGPDWILWSYDDFPRHWKPVLAYLKAQSLPGRLALISETTIPADEEKKAKELEVSGPWCQGFFDDLLAEHLSSDRTMEAGDRRQVAFVDLDGWDTSLVLDTRGVFPLQAVQASETEVRGLLYDTTYTYTPQQGDLVTIVIRSAKKTSLAPIRLSSIIEANDGNRHLRIRIKELPDAWTSLVNKK